MASAAAIIVVIAILAVMLLIVLSGRRRGGGTEPEAGADELAGPAQKKQLPASKEVFVPLPKAEERVSEKAVTEERAAEERVTEQRAAEERVTEQRAAEEPVTEKPSQAGEALDQGVAAVRGGPAPVAPTDAGAQAVAQERQAEQAARAAAARAAEARDKAIKEAATLAKAEAKAAAEAEAKAKSEARRKASEAKAKAEGKVEAKVKAPAEEPPKAPAPKAPEKEDEDEAPAKTLKDGLGRTRQEGFVAKLSTIFAGKQIDQDLMEEVEEALFTADIGARTADRLLTAVREALSKKELKDASKVWEVLRTEAQQILEGATAGGKVGTPKPGEPLVTMVLGVNGSGKTTSIGKIAHKLVAEGKKVTLVAGDTFRAAATEQLDHWARRVGAVCIKGKDGADPASVVFDGVKQAVDEKADVVLVDTAGRLQTNINLMEELKKVRRVMGRAIDNAPHEVLMVLDATTGQNGISQAKIFKDATDVTGIILTKLDGTAKGGVVLGVCDELKIPIRWIGVGERVADLRLFDAKEFVDALFSPST